MTSRKTYGLSNDLVRFAHEDIVGGNAALLGPLAGALAALCCNAQHSHRTAATGNN